MSTLLIKNIHQLVTCDDEDRVLQNADRRWTSPPMRSSTAAICSATPA